MTNAQLAHATDTLRIIELDGHWQGIGTADEIAEWRELGYFPAECTDRPATKADLA